MPLCLVRNSSNRQILSQSFGGTRGCMTLLYRRQLWFPFDDHNASLHAVISISVLTYICMHCREALSPRISLWSGRRRSCDFKDLKLRMPACILQINTINMVSSRSRFTVYMSFPASFSLFYLISPDSLCAGFRVPRYNPEKAVDHLVAVVLLDARKSTGCVEEVNLHQWLLGWNKIYKCKSSKPWNMCGQYHRRPQLTSDVNVVDPLMPASAYVLIRSCVRGK